MIRIAFAGLLVLISAVGAAAQQATFHDALLDHLQGSWVLRGTVNGQKTVHDIKAEWVLNHQYLFWQETSREKEPGGQPVYANHFYFGWDQSTSEYVCVLLDTYGGFSTESIGHAKAGHADALAFVFKELKGGEFHTSFLYDKASDTWQLNMDEAKGGKLTPFLRTKLTRD